MANDIIDIGDGMFVSADRSVVNWFGENYYRSCGMYVANIEDGRKSSCVKPLGHPSQTHEDIKGCTRDETELDFGNLSLEEAVVVAIATASVRNNNSTEESDGQHLAKIGKALMKRIREAGPIYG